MKKILPMIGLFTAAMLSGCSGTNDHSAKGDLFEESGNTINVNNKRPELYKEEGPKHSSDFGYVRHQKDPIVKENMANGKNPSIDREKLADQISQLCVDLPYVNDAATLVTDEEVLVVYITDSKNRELTADQVKKTAASAAPRYYHVYVSDNSNLMKNLESHAQLHSNARGNDGIINKLIQEMKKSPQGKKISSGENENGESKDDMNKGM